MDTISNGGTVPITSDILTRGARETITRLVLWVLSSVAAESRHTTQLSLRAPQFLTMHWIQQSDVVSMVQYFFPIKQATQNKICGSQRSFTRRDKPNLKQNKTEIQSRQRILA